MAHIVAGAEGRLADLINEQQAEIVVPGDWALAMGRAAWAK